MFVGILRAQELKGQAVQEQINPINCIIDATTF